jgi:hypothetical protein
MENQPDYALPRECDVCSKVRPAHLFRYQMDVHHAKYVGYKNNAKHPRGVNTTTCHVCTRTTVLPKNLTPGDLVSGNAGTLVSLSAYVLQTTARAEGRRKQAEAARKAREAQVGDEPKGWALVVQLIMRELRLNAYALVNNKRRVLRGDAQAQRMVAFLDEYNEALRVLRAQAMLNKRRQLPVPRGTTWESLLTRPTYLHLLTSWRDVPEALRVRANTKLPMILNKGDQDTNAHAPSRAESWAKVCTLKGLRVKRNGALELTVLIDGQGDTSLMHVRNVHERNGWVRKLPMGARLHITHDRNKRAITINPHSDVE